MFVESGSSVKQFRFWIAELLSKKKFDYSHFHSIVPLKKLMLQPVVWQVLAPLFSSRIAKSARDLSLGQLLLWPSTGDGVPSWCLNWVEGLWLQQQFFPLHHLSRIRWTTQGGFKFTYLFHAFKSTQRDERLYFSWGISGTFFTQMQHEKDIPGLFFFLPWGSVAVRTCSQGSSPSSFDSPICLAWSSLFIWLTTAISTVVVQFIYSSETSFFSLASSACVQHSVNIASLLFCPRLFTSSFNSLSLLYPWHSNRHTWICVHTHLNNMHIFAHTHSVYTL